MLLQRDILEAVKEKLKSLPRFKELKAYLDETKENFETPCFFLKLIKTTKPENARAGRTQNECLLVITYFDAKDETDESESKAAEIYDIKDEITAAFWRGLKVKDRWIHFSEVTSDTDGDDADIIYMQLPFEYMDAEPDEEENRFDVIGAIHQRERVKETGDWHC